MKFFDILSIKDSSLYGLINSTEIDNETVELVRELYAKEIMQ